MKDKSIQQQLYPDFNIFLTKSKYNTFKIEENNSIYKSDKEIQLSKSISSIKSSNKSVVEQQINRKLSDISCKSSLVKQITDLTNKFKFPTKTKNRLRKNRKFIQGLSLQNNMECEGVYFSGPKPVINENANKNNKSEDLNLLENIQKDLKNKIIRMKRNAFF